MNARVMNETERAAHQYADAGWNVFPVSSGSKVPATEHGFLDATASHRQIEGWWRANPSANVGIATGTPGPDVLDIDVRPSGSGWASLNQLNRAGLVPDAGAMVRTPSGGGHLYFAGTEQRNGHLPGQHLDFRSLGGYVVAPPSTVDGKPYLVVKHQPVAATFDWQAARDHLSPAAEAKPSPRPQRSPQADRSSAHLVPWLASQPAAEGNRNMALFWAANRAVEAGDHATLEQLGRAAEGLGLDKREVDRTIRSAQRTTDPQRGRETERQGQAEATAERPFVPAPVQARNEPQKEREAEVSEPEREAEMSEREQALANMGPDGVPLRDCQAYMDWVDAGLDASMSEPGKEREAEAG